MRLAEASVFVTHLWVERHAAVGFGRDVPARPETDKRHGVTIRIHRRQGPPQQIRIVRFEVELYATLARAYPEQPLTNPQHRRAAGLVRNDRTARNLPIKL